MGYFTAALLVFCAVSQASKLSSSILETYRRVLVDAGVMNEDAVNPTASDLAALMSIIDDDAQCGRWCRKYLEKLLDEHDGIFDRIVDDIYGDMISDDPYEPQEIHLALTGDFSEMRAMWVTGSPLQDPYVEYRPASGDAEWVRASATTSTYRVPRKWWPVFTGFIYDASMVNLEPGSTFEYRVRGYDAHNSTERASDTFSFRAAPVAGADPSRHTRFSVMADQGTFMLLGFAAQAKLAAVQDSMGIELSTVVGDLSYAGLSTAFPRLNISKEDEFEHIWDLYGIQSQAVAATRPWMVTNGNHERFYNFSAFRNRYHMPYELSGGSNDNFWYSFDYGNVHYCSISSEHDLEDGSPQKMWMEQDLAAASSPDRRAAVPWVVVAIHKPLYSSCDGAPGGYADLLEDLVIRYDVDLLLAGHMHSYERVHPVRGGEVTAYPSSQQVNGADVYFSEGKGPVYVIQGNAGGMQAERWAQPAPAWSALRFANGFVTPNVTSGVSSDGLEQSSLPDDYEYANTFGFGVVTAHNATHLEYEVVPVSGDIGVDNFFVVKRA